jgi:hypothetical protein
MTTKLYRQTFKNLGLSEVHDEVGRNGGLVVRIDQTDEETIAFFEADPDIAQEYSKDLEEVSVKQVMDL